MNNNGQQWTNVIFCTSVDPRMDHCSALAVGFPKLHSCECGTLWPFVGRCSHSFVLFSKLVSSDRTSIRDDALVNIQHIEKDERGAKDEEASGCLGQQ